MQIIVEILLFIVWLVVSFVFLFTGDIVLLILTLGKHKPMWSRYKEKTGIGTQIFAELIFWIGVGTWILLFFLFR